VRRTTINAHGLLDLGDQAHAAGYGPGAVVDVVRLSTGSLLVTLSDEPVIDLPPVKPVTAGRRHRPLAAGRRR
jgi:hypothetical protein